MADRLLNRVFNAAAAAQEPAASRPEAAVEPSEEEKLRATEVPMQAGDAIARILLAKKDKDWFRLLELPPPELDDLGRPAWDVPAADISKAYRRLSVLVHPDKNPGDDARAAFEALNEAHRCLRSRGDLEEALRTQSDAARRRREAAEAAATPEERVVMYAAKKDRARALQKQEANALQAEILRQVKEKQAAAKRKRQATSAYRQGNGDSDEEQDDGKGDAKLAQQRQETSAVRRPPPKKRHGKPSIIF